MFIRLFDAGCPVDQKYDILGGRSWMDVALYVNPDAVLALCKHSVAFVEKLVQFKAPKNTNVVSLAAASGHRPLVEFLIEQGVSPSDPNDDGETAAEVAAVREHHELAEFLRGLAET